MFKIIAGFATAIALVFSSAFMAAPAASAATSYAHNPPTGLHAVIGDYQYLQVAWNHTVGETSYTVRLIQLNGVVVSSYTEPNATENWSNLHAGWQYNVQVWANPAKSGGPNDEIKVTIPSTTTLAPLPAGGKLSGTNEALWETEAAQNGLPLGGANTVAFMNDLFTVYSYSPHTGAPALNNPLGIMNGAAYATPAAFMYALAPVINTSGAGTWQNVLLSNDTVAQMSAALRNNLITISNGRYSAIPPGWCPTQNTCP